MEEYQLSHDDAPPFYEIDNLNQIADLDTIYDTYVGCKTDGFFVDVGAFDCFNWSNTSFLADIGWSGIMIEPQPDRASECINKYLDNDRITVVQKAASNFTGETKLYTGGSQSTIVDEMIDIYNSTKYLRFSGLELQKYMYVKTDTLDNILEENGAPERPSGEIDVLSIDVEGAECLVLEGLTISRWLPKLVIIEAYEQREDEPQLSHNTGWINRYMQQEWYVKIYSDYINNIYTLAR